MSYGAQEITGVSGASLAVTGLSIGGWVLAGIGLIFVGIAIVSLVKRNGKHHP